MNRDPLEVRYNDRLVASVQDHGLGVCSLQYDSSAVGDSTAMVSVRLPPRAEPYPEVAGVAAFLNGVLPEGWVREQLAAIARIPANDTFGLLARYGRDCAGALSFVDPTEAPVADDVRWMTHGELEQTIRTLRTAPLGVLLDVGARISLGGVQEKLVVVIDGDRFGVPLGNTPSTHILKPSQLEPDGQERYPGLVAVEHYCMTLARRIAEEAEDRLRGVAFEAPRTTMLQLADRDVLCIERYDRTANPVRRIHQEDGCQALGLQPENKYQRTPGQLPTFAAFADVLLRHGIDPLADLRALLQLIVFSVCAGNADLHAKNLSLLHRDGVRLAPVYDIVSTATYIGVDQELGMRIGAQYHLDDVNRGDLLEEASQWNLGTRAATAAIDATCAAIIDTADAVYDELGRDGASHPRLDDIRDRFVQVAQLLRT